MKRVLVYAPCDNHAQEAAFRIRILALGPAMERRGFQWVIKVRGKGLLARRRLTRHARDVDAVILHRKWLDPWEVRLLRRNLRPDAGIWMDIDDATMLNEKPLGWIARRRLERRFAATCRVLTGACVGNDYLADLFARQNVQTSLVPSVVEPRNYLVKQHANGKPVRLVWIGSGSTLKYLEQSLPWLEQAAASLPHLGLDVICDRPLPTQSTALDVRFIPWTLDGEAESLAAADIGIAPTPDTPWTRGKCGFKIVQYMAAGLPVIASPVGANAALVRSDAGILPANAHEWSTAIMRLAADASLRQTIGKAGRARVETDLSVERAADIWAKTLA